MFLTFSEGIEMEHWHKVGESSIFIPKLKHVTVYWIYVSIFYDSTK